MLHSAPTHEVMASDYREVEVSAQDERKEVRAQRHDFIKEYYKMATLDLDRHLKAGWQTIAVLAGGAAILTAGHDGKIGMPIATMIALFSAFWGVLSVVDANYWSLRAIGFLSNVEAIYFSKEDRRVFNPYVGFHPPFKLLNSLRYMFWLSVLFGAASILNMMWELTNLYKTPRGIWNYYISLDALPFLFWSLPILVVFWGSYWATAVWLKRLGDYINFSQGAPGPGIRTVSKDYWHVTFEGIEGEGAIDIDRDVQRKMLSSLVAKRSVVSKVIHVLLWLYLLLSAPILIGFVCRL